MFQGLFSFQGRVNRAKFWLISILMGVIFGVVFGVVMGGAMSSMSDPNKMPSVGTVPMIILGVLYILMLWIGLALGVKRWHDRNKSGWWVLIALVPVIGGLWYLIECGFLKGTTGPNKYGADPLGGVA